MTSLNYLWIKSVILCRSDNVVGIMHYFYGKSNKMHKSLNLFHFWKTLYIFRTVFPTIIRRSNCTYSRQTELLTACLISRWWTERPSEICRVFFKNKINWDFGASCWIYYRNILRCKAPWTSDYALLRQLQFSRATCQNLIVYSDPRGCNILQYVYKMWIIQEPNKLALWNKLHFEEKKTESIEHV